MSPLLTIAATASLLATLSACDRTTIRDPSVEATAESDDSSSSVAATEASMSPDLALPEDVQNGVCLAHNWQDGGVDGYGTSTSRETLRHLKELGVEAISLTPFGWMSGLHGVEIKGEHTGDMPEGGEHSRALEAMIEQVHDAEMSVVLKPHLWIRDGAWRGEIEPKVGGESAWARWWREYRAFISYYARLAERTDVETLVVGVELDSAIEANPEAFRSIIESVRSNYDGRLTYAANWHGSSMSPETWKRLDSVGVQFYPPLTDAQDPTIGQLRRAIREHLADWQSTAERADRPLEVLEVGYKSATTAVSNPWGWPEHLEENERRVAEKLQADAYRALFAELARLDRLYGVYIWKYFTDPRRDEGGEVGFSPREKRAESVLRRAYRSAD